MDFDEFEMTESNINVNLTYNEEIEFVTKELDSMAHAAGRYSRSVQIPRAMYIIKKLKEMGALENKR